MCILFAYTYFVSLDGPLQMVVTWVTFNSTPSVVEYGTDDLSLIEYGNTTKFDDKNDTGRVWYMHRVILDNLKPGMRYCK